MVHVFVCVCMLLFTVGFIILFHFVKHLLLVMSALYFLYDFGIRFDLNHK